MIEPTWKWKSNSDVVLNASFALVLLWTFIIFVLLVDCFAFPVICLFVWKVDSEYIRAKFLRFTAGWNAITFYMLPIDGLIVVEWIFLLAFTMGALHENVCLHGWKKSTNYYWSSNGKTENLPYTNYSTIHSILSIKLNFKLDNVDIIDFKTCNRSVVFQCPSPIVLTATI